MKDVKEGKSLKDFQVEMNRIARTYKVGHSGLIGFHADGDGDFRPKFEIDRKHEPKAGLKTHIKPEIVFDAG